MHKRAKGAAERRQTGQELASSLGGALDTATVLREFFRRARRLSTALVYRKRYSRYRKLVFTAKALGIDQNPDRGAAPRIFGAGMIAY